MIVSPYEKIDSRKIADGKALEFPSDEELATLRAIVEGAEPEAIAISLLFSFANPKNEESVAAAVAGMGKPLSISHKILPEFREYERTSTVVVNAYLQRSRLYRDRRDFDMAIQDADAALRLEPGRAEAYRVVGVIGGSS